MRGLGRHCGTALGLGGHFRTGALAMRRSNHAGSPPRFQRAVEGGISSTGICAPQDRTVLAQRRRGAGKACRFRSLSSSRLRGFACGSFPSWFCLTRRTDPFRKGCFAAMNWWSSMHAPGEGTRPSDPWFVLNERVLSSLVAKKGPKTRSTRRPTG
jgi:hypothetical protein